MLSRLQAARRLMYDVPWCVPQVGAAELRASVAAAVTGRLVRGPDAEAVGAVVARQCGRRFGVAFNRGRTAVEMALRALELGPGAEVVLPSYVCSTLLDGVVAAGAAPRFADVGPDLNVNRATVEAALTERTRCVIVPHLFGKAAPIGAIEKLLRGRDIALIDDAAQSFGAADEGRMVGSFGRFGVVGCGLGKALSGPAGGVLLTDERSLYERVLSMALPRESWRLTFSRLAAFWLWRRSRRYTLPAATVWRRLRRAKDVHVPGPMSNVDAAIALEQVRSLRHNAALRRRNAEVVMRWLGRAAEWSITELGDDSVVLKLVLVLPADGPTVATAVEQLAAVGIEAQRGYRPCHLTAAPEQSLPVTERLWERVLCIPLETAPPAAVLSRRIDLAADRHAGPVAMNVVMGRTEELQ